MFIFSKEETLVTLLILFIVGFVSYFNFRDSLLRARDSTRRDDLGGISNQLHRFYEDFGYFPPSVDGKILYCKDEDFEEVLVDVKNQSGFDRQLFFEGLRPCQWGEDQFDDLLDDNYSPYIEKLPVDPKSKDGLQYVYISNQNRFQIYTYLEEGPDAPGYDDGIVKRELNCGIGVCNYGRSYAQTPLDISLDEYERLLLEEQSQKN